MTILLLDRNVVIAIDDQLQGKSRSYSSELEKLDRAKFTVSCLLSVFETHRAAERNAEAIAQSIDREATIISRFFKRAGTDSAFLKKDAVNLANIFASEFSRSHVPDMQFVAELQRRLCKQTGSEMARDEFMALADFIQSLGRQLADPASLVGLACVLGSPHARKLLKPVAAPTADQTFNALADIEKIKLTNYIRHCSLGAGRSGNVHLHTFDKGLNALSKTICVRESSSQQGAHHETVSYVIDSDIFLNGMPFLTGKAKLKKRLKERLVQLA